MDKEKERMKQRVNVLQLVNNTVQTQIHFTMLEKLEKGYSQWFEQFFVVS